MKAAARRSSPPRESAYAAAVRVLTRSSQSQAQLRRKLERRGYAAGEADQAIARLTAAGYLDDRAFAAGLVRSRSRTRGASAIAVELRVKGIAREIAQAALEELEPQTQLEAALRVAYRASPGADGQPSRVKLVGRLQRKGFSAPVIRATLARLEADPEQAVPGPNRL